MIYDAWDDVITALRRLDERLNPKPKGETS